MSGPCSVTSARTAVGGSGRLSTLRDDQGRPLAIPGNGGAACSVIVQWEDATGISTGAVVLFGCVGSIRVPLCVGYLARLDAGGPSLHAIFNVAGLAFDHFEVDAAGWWNTGEGTGTPFITAIAIVGGAPASSPLVHVLERCARTNVGTFTLPALLTSQLWGDLVRPVLEPRDHAAVTPADATVVDFPNGLYVGLGGTVIGRLKGSTASVTYSNVPSGSYLRGHWVRVDTATTATGIVGLKD